VNEPEPLRPEDQDKLNSLNESEYIELRRRAFASLEKLIQRTSPAPVALAEGYHGRWNELSLEDFKFLFACGISIE
jgi:hypothetical protein